MAEVTLQIEGMHCGSCVRRVSQALGSSEGIEVKEVRVGAARFAAIDSAAAVERAIASLAAAGFKAHPETAEVKSES